jgi:hypothetical protein
MTKLTLPVFQMPALPVKEVPVAVWRTWNTEFVRRLKITGEYARLRESPMRQAVTVPFCLRG